MKTDQSLDRLIKHSKDVRVSAVWGSSSQSGEAMSQIIVNQMEIDVELIKTIRQLDAKNSLMQQKLFWLAFISSLSAVIAVFVSIVE